MRVLIVHGWGASSQSNWFPWLKKELERRGAYVYSPDLPNTTHPRLNEWLGCLLKTVDEFDGSLSILGHSLGVITTLRLLERIEAKIGTVVLVAGFTHPHWATSLAPFFEKPIPWESLRSKARKFIVIESSNDPLVPSGEGKQLCEQLGAQFIQEAHAGHFTSHDGYTAYPRMADLLLSSG